MQKATQLKRWLAIGCLALGAGIANAENQVIAVYEGQTAYLQAALAAESPDLDSLAKEHIVDPYLELCSAGLSAEDRKDSEQTMGRPITNLDQLSTNLDELEERKTAARLQAIRGTVYSSVDK